MESLNEINFKNLLKLDLDDPDAYTFEEYRTNGYKHPTVLGFCVSCEEKGINTAKGSEGFKLSNISHGTHSRDFFLSLKIPCDTSNWHQDPVLFVFESPSLDYGIFEDPDYCNWHKRPAKNWYWIYSDQKTARFPEYFRGGTYGEFVFSAILTFKLSNVYITNLMKCGLNDEKGGFRGLADFRPECIKNCFDEVLKKELDAFSPKLIFAMGTGVEQHLQKFIKDQYPLYHLPHPAGRRRGFRDDYYRTLYFWTITKALYDQNIISSDETETLLKRFCDHS